MDTPDGTEIVQPEKFSEGELFVAIGTMAHDIEAS